MQKALFLSSDNLHWFNNGLTIGLQRLAEQRFDPEKFAGIFTSGGGGPPRWLHGNNGLLADKCVPSLCQKPIFMKPLIETSLFGGDKAIQDSSIHICLGTVVQQSLSAQRRYNVEKGSHIQ